MRTLLTTNNTEPRVYRNNHWVKIPINDPFRTVAFSVSVKRIEELTKKKRVTSSIK